ncbi:hypothetical protein ACI797_16625 [Geodermatophilus sp. SYSU D00691]
MTRAEGDTDGEEAPGTAFYTVADARFFPGVAALLNSLRLAGHDEPLFVVDAGLTEQQRERLAPHVTVLPAPTDEEAVLLAPTGPLQVPADVAVLVDADIVVLRSLSEVVEQARAGRVTAFLNIPPNDDRSFPDWGPALDLGEIRPQPYVNAGLVAVPAALQKRLLPRWIELQRVVAWSGTRYGGARMTDPFYFADQDVLNALLSSRFGPDEVEILEYRLAPHPPFHGLRLTDPDALVCRYDGGTVPYLLHHTMHKPWLRATRTTVYSRLLTRLLLRDDVAIRMRPEELPSRLREGIRADLARRRDTTLVTVRSELRRQLGRFGIRTRIAAARAARQR